MGTTTVLAPTVSQRAVNSDLLRRLKASFHAWRKHDRQMADLAVMSDDQLKDIGVTRGDVYREMYAD